MADVASRIYEVIAVRRGEELRRVTVVASSADVALEKGRALLEAQVNLFDFEISFLVDQTYLGHQALA